MISPYLIKIIPYYLNLCVGMATLWLGFYTLSKNTKNHLCWLFFTMCMASGLTSGFSAALDLVAFHFNYIEGFFVLSYPAIGGAVPSLSLLFLVLFPEKSSGNFSKKIWIVLLPIPYFVYLGLGRLYYTKLYILDKILHIERTPFYLHYIAYCTIVYISYFLIINLKIRKSTSSKHINQLKIVLWGALIGGFLILLGMVLTYFKIFLYGYEFGIFIFLGSIAIAMLRYQAFEIKTAFHYGLFWLLSRVVGIIPILFLPWSVQYFYFNPTRLAPAILSLYGFFCVVFFSLLQKTFFKKIDKLLLQRRLSLEKATVKFSETLYRVRNIEELTRLTFTFLEQNIFPKKAFIFIHAPINGPQAFEGFSSELVDKNFIFCLPIDTIEAWISTSGSNKVLILSEECNSFFSDSKIIPPNLADSDIKVIQFITSEYNKILGILYLSERKDFKPYSQYEIEFITALSKIMAMGLNGIYSHQKNQELYQAKTFLKEALDGISHELKTAFYSASGTKDLVLKGGIKGEDDLKQLYLDTVSFSEYIFHMVRNYGLSEKIEVGNICISKTWFKFVDAVAMAIKLNDYYKRDKDILVSCQGDDQIQVCADQEKIIVILSNLINNAIKYSDAHGSLDIHWENQDNRLYITVKDFGCGIPKEKLHTIFDKTSNQKVERGNNYFSLGFGLSVTRALVGLHEGKIKIESEVGRGTIVTLEIPL